MSFDLLIEDVEVVTSEAVFRAHVLVKNGETAGIIRRGLADGISAAATIDGKGRHLLPGMVDVHTHIDEQWDDIDFDMSPYRPVNDDLESATKAAAAGGITTVSLMPASFPVVNTAGKLRRRAEYSTGRSHVDFALLGGAGVEMLDTIVPQAEAGAIGYKSYLREFRSARKGLINQDAGDLFLTMEQVERTNCPVGFHSEDAFLAKTLRQRMVESGFTGPEVWNKAQPESCEILSTTALLECAKFTGAPLHLVHMSSPRAINLATQWRDYGADVSVETCPHYLFFCEVDMKQWGHCLKVAPPLRRRESMERLWDLLRDDEVQILATDHAPGYKEERKQAKENIFAAGGGIPVLETTIPLMLGAVSDGRISLKRLAAISAENPARRFGLYPEKGAIQIGGSADYMLVDMYQEHQFDVNEMFSMGREALKPLDGRKMQGTIVKTILGGKVVYDNGRITGGVSDGKPVKPNHCR